MTPDKFSGTLLPQDTSVLENQKAVLDLLAKINTLNSDLAVLAQTSGVILNPVNAPTDPQSGQLWYDKTRNAIIMTQAGIPITIPGTLYMGTGGTIVNSTAETSLLAGDGYGNLIIPGGFLQKWTTIRIKIRGRIQTASVAPVNTFRVYLNGFTLVSSTGAIAANIPANTYVETEVDIQCRSIGATGTVWTMGRNLFSSAAGVANVSMRSFITTVPVTVNTLVPMKLDVTYAFGTANASNNLTTDLVEIETWG